MSSHGDEDLGDCKHGHNFKVWSHEGEPSGEEVREKIVEEKIEDLEELRDSEDYDGGDFLKGIMGDPFKTIKMSAGSQGRPYGFILGAADKFETGWEWPIQKTEEKVFVTPQSNLHQEFTQRKRQAEQNINQTLSSLSDLQEQKHMLEHDIRKLRSRAEAIREGDETQIKGDFIELVDGAGGGGQAGDEASLKFYRDNNIYPSIVADFNEMRSVEDLKEPDESNLDNPRLYDLPANEKAILRKKYTMYEKWKDLYGSEVQRKLNELKQQLRGVERSIEETEEWLEPYVRDMQMIKHKDTEQLKSELDKIFSFEGYSTMSKEMEFIAHKGVKNEGESLTEDFEGEPSHYKIWYIHAVHVNISGGGNPNSPAEGPTVAQIFWHPAIVCRHVFERFFEEKLDKSKRVFEEVLEGYRGEDLATKEGREFREEREDAGYSIREFRQEIQEQLRDIKDNDDFRVPVEFSADIRRIEDGFQKPEELEKEYDEDYLEAVDELLDTKYSEDGEDEDDNKMSEFKKTVELFTGQYGPMYMSGGQEGDEMGNMRYEFKFNYYYDLKISNGMYTMN